MKISSILAVVLFGLLSFSGLVFAEGDDITSPTPVETDGTWVSDGQPLVLIDTEGYSDNTVPRTFDPNEAFGDQSVKVKLNMSAMIPCYLEMTFKGNDVNRTLKSFGPGSAAEYDGAEYVAFHPSVSGFMNGWTYIAGSTNNTAEIEPGPGVYIRGCDTFKTELWSNMSFIYSVQVKNGALQGTGDAAGLTLPVDMRAAQFVGDKDFSAVVETDYNVAHSFSAASDKAQVLNGARLTKYTVFQQFRVPYDLTVAAGHYTGEIYFLAVTQ